jgi:pilus assembly protein CpaE
VLAGARAFIPKPVKGDELTGVLRQVLSRRVALPQPIARETPMGRVIVFCAPKGGTGRTTLAINTAVALREVSREPVVVVDADYAAPAIDVALNLRGQRDIRDLLPKLNQLDSDLMSSVLATHNSGVRVLLAPPPDALDYPPTLPQVQQVTAWLKRASPWVLVDLGLPLDEAAYAFLDAADRVVMSVLPEMVGLRNAKLMLAQFDKRGYPPGKVWPLLNRDGLPGGMKQADAQTYLGRELAFAIPNDQELATETINRGVPMVIAHRRRPVAQAYRRFASLLADERKPGAMTSAVATAFAATAPAEWKPAPAARPAPQPAIAAVGAAGVASRMTAAPDSAAASARPSAGAPVDARSYPSEPDERGLSGSEDNARWWTSRRVLVSAAIVVVALLLALLAGPMVLRALVRPDLPPTAESGGLPPSETAISTPLPTLVDPTAAATRSLARTRTAETLARLLGGSSTPKDEWPPGQGQTVAPLPLTSSPSESSTASLPASPRPTSTRTPARTATPTSTLTDSPTPQPTFTPTPTATPTPPPTATATLTRVPTRRPPTLTPQPAATATPAILQSSVSPPALTSPGYNEAVSGMVTFVWLPTGPLPAGAKYEVVWWNTDEAPEAARGVAPPTTATSLAADLAPLHNAGQFRNAQVFWSVIVVRDAPYERLVSPADAERSALYYDPSGDGAAAGPPPVAGAAPMPRPWSICEATRAPNQSATEHVDSAPPVR